MTLDPYQQALLDVDIILDDAMSGLQTEEVDYERFILSMLELQLLCRVARKVNALRKARLDKDEF